MVLPLVLTCTSLRLWLQELTVSAAEVERAYAGAQKEYEEKMLFLLQKINDSAADAAAGEENTDPSTRYLSFVLLLISSSSGAHDLYYFFPLTPLVASCPFCFFGVFFASDAAGVAVHAEDMRAQNTKLKSLLRLKEEHISILTDHNSQVPPLLSSNFFYSALLASVAFPFFGY